MEGGGVVGILRFWTVILLDLRWRGVCEGEARMDRSRPAPHWIRTTFFPSADLAHRGA